MERKGAGEGGEGEARPRGALILQRGPRREGAGDGHGDGMGAAAQGIPCGDREEGSFIENPLPSLIVIANRSRQHLSEFN